MEDGYVYVEGIRNAMKVNANRVRRMNAELYLRNLETFRVQEYVGRCLDLHPGPCAHAKLHVEQFIDEVYMLQRTMRIWGNEFLIISNVSNWEFSPLAFEMLMDYSLRRHSKGRP
ncbi:hypothetical protein GOBAR_AA18023 [Gossypium barbadense]|uniref:Uncharacterized protein n=1 Tax=Gossypium barbadense TaxID=3634 RepID=A0A2P5XH07_GOSBA|nr:hypothetical protein GOBAR_AA18023 [Gossypium barbadense]